MLIVAVLLVGDLFVEFLSSTLVTVIVQFSWVRFCTAGGWGWGGCSKLYNVGLHQRINCPPLGCTHWKPPAVRYGQMLSFIGVYVTFKVQFYGFFWLHSVPTYVTEVSLWSTSRVYLLTFLKILVLKNQRNCCSFTFSCSFSIDRITEYLLCFFLSFIFSAFLSLSGLLTRYMYCSLFFTRNAYLQLSSFCLKLFRQLSFPSVCPLFLIQHFPLLHFSVSNCVSICANTVCKLHWSVTHSSHPHPPVGNGQLCVAVSFF